MEEESYNESTLVQHDVIGGNAKKPKNIYNKGGKM